MACRHSHSFVRCGTFMDEHVDAAHQVHDALPAVQGKNDDKGRIDGKPGSGKGTRFSGGPAFRHDCRHAGHGIFQVFTGFGNHPRLFLKRFPQCPPILRLKSVIPSCSRMIFSRCSGNITFSRQRHRGLLHVHPDSPIFSSLIGQEPSSLQKNTKNTSLLTDPCTYSCFSAWFIHGRVFHPKYRGFISPFKAPFSCRASVPSHARAPAQEDHD